MSAEQAKRIVVGGGCGSGTCWLANLIGDYIDAPTFVDFSNYDNGYGVVKHEGLMSEIPVKVDQCFYILRDMRDVFVSRYYKHVGMSKWRYLGRHRHMRWFLRNWKEHGVPAFQYYNKVNDNWLNSPYPGTTYEKLRENTHKEFQTLLEKAGWKIDTQKIKSVIEANEFDAAKKRGSYAWCAKSGMESYKDAPHYYRKGKAGEWTNLPKDILLKIEIGQRLAAGPTRDAATAPKRKENS